MYAETIFKFHWRPSSTMICFIYQSFIVHIFLSFYGVETISVVIEGSEEGSSIGGNGTEIECSYTQDNFYQFSVNFMAFNKSSITFETIATFYPDEIVLLNTAGQFLKGRVTLTPITQSSIKAVMTFNKIMCIDDTFYRCQVIYSNVNGHFYPISNNISISVQVPPSKPDSISVVHMPADSSVTTTKHMDYSTSSPVITSKEHETVSALQSVTMNNTTTINDSTLPKTTYDTTSSIPSNDDFSSDIRYRNNTYLIQQTPTAQGIVEGDNITVVCRGDVGKPPANHVFQKYLNGKMVPMQDTVNATPILEMSENCSYYRTSSFTFQVTADDNNAVIRCVVNWSMAELNMYVETAPIEVYSDKSTPSTSSSSGNKTKDIGIVIAIVAALLIVIVVLCLLYRRYCKKDNKPVDSTGSNMGQIESQKTTRDIPPTNSTKKTTGYEDIDFDNIDMKCKLLSNEETNAIVKQHMNDEYLEKQKEDEDKEKDNPTTPPQAAVYACVNKPKNTVTIENNTTAGQQEEDLYEESKEGIYDTSGDRRHKENISAENYNSTENLKNEESDHDEQKSQVGAYINKAFENDSGNKEEKRQVATVSPTVRLSFGYQGDGQKNKSNEIQPKNTNQPVKPKGQTGSTEKQSNQETSL